MPSESGQVTLKDIMAYFGMSASEFMREWKKMSQKDKEEVKTAFNDGSLTY